MSGADVNLCCIEHQVQSPRLTTFCFRGQISIVKSEPKDQAEQTRKNALESLFKTLLSLLMTGKIRVKDLEI